jgi:hypothetical protein
MDGNTGRRSPPDLSESRLSAARIDVKPLGARMLMVKTLPIPESAKRDGQLTLGGSANTRALPCESGDPDVAKTLSRLICGVAFLIPRLTPCKQALHDILSDGVVVRT